MARKLILIPIVHAAGDIVREGIGVPTSMRDRSDRFWNLVTTYIQNTDLPFDRLRVYQDTLPFIKEVSERMERAFTRHILDDYLADSPNFNLLRWLNEKGAEITGTEDPSLLKQAKEAADARDGEKMMSIVPQRDQAIAERISATLKVGDLGLLFIGYEHAVAEFLGADIEVETPQAIEDFFRLNFEGERTQDFGRRRRL